MAYSDALADRVRHLLARQAGIEEKRMFGGLSFLLFGRLAVGVWRDSLLARLGPDRGEAALKQPDVEPFVNGTRVMRGWVVIGPDGIENDERLAGWVRQAIDFAGQMPARSS